MYTVVIFLEICASNKEKSPLRFIRLLFHFLTVTATESRVCDSIQIIKLFFQQRCVYMSMGNFSERSNIFKSSMKCDDRASARLQCKLQKFYRPLPF